MSLSYFQASETSAREDVKIRNIERSEILFP